MGGAPRFLGRAKTFERETRGVRITRRQRALLLEKGKPLRRAGSVGRDLAMNCGSRQQAEGVVAARLWGVAGRAACGLSQGGEDGESRLCLPEPLGRMGAGGQLIVAGLGGKFIEASVRPAGFRIAAVGGRKGPPGSLHAFHCEEPDVMFRFRRTSLLSSVRGPYFCGLGEGPRSESRQLKRVRYSIPYPMVSQPTLFLPWLSAASYASVAISFMQATPPYHGR